MVLLKSRVLQLDQQPVHDHKDLVAHRICGEIQQIIGMSSRIAKSSLPSVIASTAYPVSYTRVMVLEYVRQASATARISLR